MRLLVTLATPTATEPTSIRIADCDAWDIAEGGVLVVSGRMKVPDGNVVLVPIAAYKNWISAEVVE